MVWAGGGSQLSELVRVPVKADCLGRTSFVIVLDLSKVSYTDRSSRFTAVAFASPQRPAYPIACQ